MLNFVLITLATSVNAFLGLLKFINLLNITFYYRNIPKVVNVAIFSPTVDLWIWSVSLLFIVLVTFLMKTLGSLSFPRWTFLPFLFSPVSLAVLLVNDRIAYFAIPLGFMIVGLSIYYGNGYLVTRREKAFSLTLMCITGLLILIELASFSSWVLNIFCYEIPFGLYFESVSTLRWIFPWIDLQLFNALYPLTSWLFLVFLYSWIWIPASKYILSRFSVFKHTLLRTEKSNLSPIQRVDNLHSQLKVSSRSLALGMLLSLVAAAFIVYYPYIRLPSSVLLGIDSVSYNNWLKEMMQKGPFIALNSDRPFFKLLMYFIRYVTASPPETVIRVMPILLAVSLNLAIFWFVKVGTKNELLALMSSLLTSFSLQTTVGVFAYFLANWLALIEIFLLLVFLLKSFEKHSWKYMSISTLIGMTVLLTHPYTWNVLMAILITYLIWIFLRRKPEEKFEIALLIFLLAANLMFYAVYALTPFGKGASNGEGGVLHELTSDIGISNFFNLQNNLAFMVQKRVGGLFGDPMLIILAVAGVFSMMDFTKRFNRIMLLWVMIPSLALLPVSEPFYFRLIYLIPLQIQAAAGLYLIFNKLKDTKGNFKTAKAFHILRISIITLILLFLLNYSLRMVDILSYGMR